MFAHTPSSSSHMCRGRHTTPSIVIRDEQLWSGRMADLFLQFVSIPVRDGSNSKSEAHATTGKMAERSKAPDSG